MARAAYASRITTWEAWEAVSNQAQGESRKLNIGAVADGTQGDEIYEVLSLRGTVFVV